MHADDERLSEIAADAALKYLKNEAATLSLRKATYDFALTVPDGQAFNGAAFQGTKIIVSGVGYVPPGGDTSHIDAFVVRLDDDTIFANSFE